MPPGWASVPGGCRESSYKGALRGRSEDTWGSTLPSPARSRSSLPVSSCFLLQRPPVTQKRVNNNNSCPPVCSAPFCLSPCGGGDRDRCLIPLFHGCENRGSERQCLPEVTQGGSRSQDGRLGSWHGTPLLGSWCCQIPRVPVAGAEAWRATGLMFRGTLHLWDL